MEQKKKDTGFLSNLRGKFASPRSNALATTSSFETRARRPTTERALMLRRGKHGVLGTGEVSGKLINPDDRISGRDKLEILAEHFMKNIVRAPYDSEMAYRISRSRLDACLDDLGSMRDSLMCYDIVKEEMQVLLGDNIDLEKLPDFSKEFSTIALNKYIIAAAWWHVSAWCSAFYKDGLDKSGIRYHFKNPDVMNAYFTTVEFVRALVNIGTQRLRQTAQRTPHYASFFRRVEPDEMNPSDNDTPQIMFDWNSVRSAYKSFLDSIIIEMCLPNSKYPISVLLTCLHDSAAEAPKETKRFPQAMWDAIGDLSDAVQLLDLLESPLFTNEDVIKSRGELSREYLTKIEYWEDTQYICERALDQAEIGEFKLSWLKDDRKLQYLWSQLEEACSKNTGQKLDDLWKMSRQRGPQYVSSQGIVNGNSKAVVLSSAINTKKAPSKSKKNKMPKLIPARSDLLTNSEHQDSEDSDSSGMPGLQTDSSGFTDEESDSHSEDEDGDDEEDEDDEDAYESGEEDQLRKFEARTIDLVFADPDFLDPTKDKEGDRYAAERKSNPFLNMLGNLRGRLFTTPKVTKTSTRVPGPRSKADPSQAQEDGLGPLPGETEKKKKKKKPKRKKKKKKATGADAAMGAEEVEEDEEGTDKESERSAPQAASALIPQPAPPSPSKASSKKAKTKAKATPAAQAEATPPGDPKAKPSVDTLASSLDAAPFFPREEVAQSARSYLKEAKLNETKAKVKSRPQDPVDSNKHEELKKAEDNLRRAINPEKQPEPTNLFSGLRKKTVGYMRKLVGKSPKGKVKWDQFVKIMTDMGFTYVASTAGSSVRFDHHDPNVVSVIFHKPHPDPTLERNLIRRFAYRLQKRYAWSEELLDKEYRGGALSSDSE